MTPLLDEGNDVIGGSAMIDTILMAAILDSLKYPVLFTDINHIVRYMNKAAVNHYEGGESLIGTSLFECHNEQSRNKILEIMDLMQAGKEDEQLISDEEGHLIFMRAVRDADGKVLGYYERYEPITK